MSDNSNSALSLDRMRTMLLRAAEIRDSEQQQIFDALDEIHGRLAALDALGTVRKRLTELPDRAEIKALAERLDETVAKLDAQDMSLAALVRGFDAVADKITDKLAIPLAGLDSRLDGVAGRFEGVAGRLDGLEDRLSGLYKRFGELDNRLDRHDVRLDGIPSAVTGALRERLDGLDSGLRGRLDEVDQALHQSLDGTRDGLRTALADGLAEIRAGMYSRLDALATQFAALTSRLDQVGDMLVKLVRQANEESERRNAGQLDEAMAAIAEMIIGRGSPVAAASRSLPRRGRGKMATKVQEGDQTTGGDGSASSEE